VVVAVGLMLVEPLADVDVNAPGVMAILVAPAAAQLSVLLVPEFMLVGFAVKEVIIGAEPFPEDEFDEVPEAQPVGPTQTNRVRTRAQTSSPEELSPRELNLFLQNDLGESMDNPFVAVVPTSVVSGDLSCLLVASTESDCWSRKGNGPHSVRAWQSTSNALVGPAGQGESEGIGAKSKVAAESALAFKCVGGSTGVD